jgi:hypothetical protein
MSVRIRSRRYYECDTEAERDLSWGPDALIYCIDTDTYFKIFAGDYVEVPLDEIFFVSPIDINKIAISGVPDGFKFLRDDGSWAEPEGGGSGSGGLLVAEYKFDTTITMADPGNGYVRINNAVYASVTQVAISVLTSAALDITRILAAISSGDILYIQDKDDATRAARFKVTAAPVNNTTWFQIPVAHVSSQGTLFGNNNTLAVAFGFVTLDGSGHVIWDEADTPMAQETVLQFKRLNVTAESGKTVVTRPADTFIGLAPPSNPVEGDIWTDSESWRTFKRYDSFWVEENVGPERAGSNLLQVLTVDNDAGAIQIKNIADGVDPQDAVSKLQMETYVLSTVASTNAAAKLYLFNNY